MRKFLEIDLATRSVEIEQLEGEAIIRACRYYTAKTLVDRGVATVEPLSPENPLIFSAGPLAGTNFSNANRLSVGCRSPLTGGIKESNSGGTFAFALGQLELSGFTLNNAVEDWVVIHIQKNGEVRFDSAKQYVGKSNFEAAALLHDNYGKKVSLAICGPGWRISGTDIRDSNQRYRSSAVASCGPRGCGRRHGQ